ncbi:MAG: ECF transporter S component [Firmicutes bacterium]|nr:ECF transporter S component [Bacillota bacterium]
MRNNRMSTQLLVKLALMTAISLVLVTMVRIPFPPMPFLVYNPADVPIYITAFAYGPIPGLIVTFIVCFIQAFLMGGDGIYGFVMHFIATGIVATVIGTLYNRSKTRKTAAKALVIGVILTIIIMCIMNIFVTSAFMGVPKEAILSMLPLIILFNFLKAGANSVLTFVLYKRISGFLHNERNTSK